ncbi:MAG: D-arabinono-1,4-lactone oxidase [Stackebrandtia sp.]
MRSIHIHVREGTRWTNWAGTARTTPSRVLRPTTREQIAEAVTSVADDGGQLKVTGSGHSFTGIAAATDVRLSLDGYRPTPIVDAANQRVTVAAGTRLRELNALLVRNGLALPNLGDIDAQTLAGATATGTHGTGAKLGGLATGITGVWLVDGSGRQREYGAGDPELPGVALGLGSLGVITDLTIQCVPAFRLLAEEHPMPLDRAIADFDGLAESNDHLEFYWFPRADRVLVKRNNRAGDGQPLSRLRRWWDDEVMSNAVYGTVCRLGKTFPATVPTITSLSARLMASRTFMDESHRVFCTPRRVRFVEMEYALPRAAFASAFAALREAASKRRVVFPVEVRVAAADELWLSTAGGRDSVYFAVHQFQGMPYREYFAEVEAIMRDHDGRPHWGKLHTRTAEDLEPAYPRYADFRALRDELDPDRLFANSYLDRVLG